MNTKTKSVKVKLAFPDGEFTTKDLVAASGLKQPAVHLQIKSAIGQNLVREVRRERIQPKGRPYVVYSKV